MAQPDDLTSHIQEILEPESPPADASGNEIKARSQPMARDGFALFVYTILTFAVLAEAVSITWMDLQ